MNKLKLILVDCTYFSEESFPGEGEGSERGYLAVADWWIAPPMEELAGENS